MQKQKITNDTTKSVKVFIKTHGRLKVHIAKKKVSVADFVSFAIDQQIKRDNAPKPQLPNILS